MVENEEAKQEEDVLEKAEKIAKRLEDANKRADELLAKNVALQTRNILGGKSNAGQPPEQPKQISPREYAEAAFKGKILK